MNTHGTRERIKDLIVVIVLGKGVTTAVLSVLKRKENCMIITDT